jgi:type IV secretion system protein VirD4
MTTKEKIVVFTFSLIVAIGAFSYIAGAVYLWKIGQDYNNATPLTYLSYWYWYARNAYVKTQLLYSGGIALIPFVLFAVILFSPKRKSLHGDARFAKNSEIKKAGLLNDKGIILATSKNKIMTFDGSEHCYVAAPTRSGKGVSIVIPNLLSWNQSVVVLDVKQENFDITSKYRAENGQECFLFNPTAKDNKSHRWNPLDYISHDKNKRINDIQKIAGFLYPDIKNQDPIWTASSRSLFLAIVLYIMETPKIPLNMASVLKVATSDDISLFFASQISERKDTENELSEAFLSSFNDFNQTAPNTKTSIRKTFTSRLELWQNPTVAAATSTNDFDLRDVRKKKMSIYVGVTPDDLERMQPILNLFFQQLIDLNTYELPAQNKDLKYTCLLMMDEFTAMGEIKILSKGLGYIAGYGLRMMPIIQSEAQITDVYGKEVLQTFIDNHAARIVFTPRQYDEAEKISKLLGNQTWDVKNKTKGIGFSSKKQGHSETTNSHARALMLPQEVLDMSEDNAIIFVRGTLPIFAKKLRYYESAIFIDRLKSVSPSLAALGKKLPTKAELENATNNGELASPIRTLLI